MTQQNQGGQHGSQNQGGKDQQNQQGNQGGQQGGGQQGGGQKPAGAVDLNNNGGDHAHSSLAYWYPYSDHHHRLLADASLAHRTVRRS